jgi:hypothetical protein
VDKKNKLNKNMLIIFITLAIVISLIVLFVIILSDKSPNYCNSFSVDNCPSVCAVCPPCEVCSSISCKSVEFCEGIGFNKSWYDSVKPKINET